MKFLILILAFISLQLFSAEGGPCGNFLSEDGLRKVNVKNLKLITLIRSLYKKVHKFS